MSSFFTGVLMSAVVDRFLTDLASDRDGTICKIINIIKDKQDAVSTIFETAKNKLFNVYDINYCRLFLENFNLCLMLQSSKDPHDLLNEMTSDVDRLIKSHSDILERYSIPKLSISASIVNDHVLFSVPVSEKVRKCIESSNLLPAEVSILE
jgi:hypothetical protein